MKLLTFSRLWKIHGGKDDIEDLNTQVYATKGDIDQLPITAHGEILDNAEKIDQLNIAHDETLMLELKLSTDPKSVMPFAFTPGNQDNQMRK